MPSVDQAQVVKIQGWRGDVLQQAGLLELARECGQEPVQIVQEAARGGGAVSGAVFLFDGTICSCMGA